MLFVNTCRCTCLTKRRKCTQWHLHFWLVKSMFLRYRHKRRTVIRMSCVNSYRMLEICYGAAAYCRNLTYGCRLLCVELYTVIEYTVCENECISIFTFLIVYSFSVHMNYTSNMAASFFCSVQRRHCALPGSCMVHLLSNTIQGIFLLTIRGPWSTVYQFYHTIKSSRFSNSTNSEHFSGCRQLLIRFHHIGRLTD